MRWILCLTMLAALGYAPAPVYRPKPDPVAEHLALLQGRWLLTDFKSGGESRPITSELFVVFEARSMRWFEGSRFHITFDATKPGEVLKAQNVARSDYDPIVVLYRGSHDELILCGSQRDGVAPEAITGGTGMHVFTFKRSPKP